MASWCGLRPCLTSALAIRAAAGFVHGHDHCVAQFVPNAAAPALASGGVDAARLIGERPEGASRRDVQGEAGHIDIAGDGRLERSAQTSGPDGFSDLYGLWLWHRLARVCVRMCSVCALAYSTSSSLRQLSARLVLGESGICWASQRGGERDQRDRKSARVFQLEKGVSAVLFERHAPLDDADIAALQLRWRDALGSDQGGVGRDAGERKPTLPISFLRRGPA